MVKATRKNQPQSTNPFQAAFSTPHIRQPENHLPQFSGCLVLPF
ncbi:hypothetical protein [Kingella oralis]|uniref:Uncharacterized protein n=1 Tax=Kingella oralis ATCC 51147 TaxID=629741 RepID=C4GLZ0_9NEIS|nr:hypothetical protein [Kingella oralis]EEP67141.1 hypothetical protein GCWU000324_02714 [Kingella oralis ATCC 51147]